MTLEEMLYSVLSSDTAIKVIVDDKAYPLGEVPQDVEEPYIVYQIIYGPGSYSHDGPTLTSTRVQITPFAQGYKQVKDLRTAIDNAMAAWRDNFNVHGWPFKTNEYDIYGYQKDYTQVPIDYIIWY